MSDVDLPEIEIDAELADRLRDAQQAYDEVYAYLESVKDEIKSRYADVEGVRGVHNGETIFTCVRRASTRLSGSRLKRDYPSIWDAYAETKSTVYMTITRPKAAA